MEPKELSKLSKSFVFVGNVAVLASVVYITWGVYSWLTGYRDGNATVIYSVLIVVVSFLSLLPLFTYLFYWTRFGSTPAVRVILPVLAYATTVLIAGFVYLLLAFSKIGLL